MLRITIFLAGALFGCLLGVLTLVIYLANLGTALSLDEITQYSSGCISLCEMKASSEKQHAYCENLSMAVVNAQHYVKSEINHEKNIWCVIKSGMKRKCNIPIADAISQIKSNIKNLENLPNLDQCMDVPNYRIKKNGLTYRVFSMPEKNIDIEKYVKIKED